MRASYPFMGVHITAIDGYRTPICPHLPDNGIKWTVDDQAWAVQEGFFVERATRANKPIVNERADFIERMPHHPDWHYVNSVDERRSMATIERHVFWMTPGYDKLLRFIEQQDRHAYVGAWDRQVERCTKELFWYKHWVRNNVDRRSRLDAEHRRKIDAQREAVEGTRNERLMRKSDEPKPSKIAERLQRWRDRELEIEEAKERRREEYERIAAEYEARQRAPGMRPGQWDARNYNQATSRAKPVGKLRISPDTIDRALTERELREECERLARERIARRGW